MAVLIPYDISKNKLRRILDHIQGFVVPGGGSDLGEFTGPPTPLMQTIQYVVDYSKERLDKDGVEFPIFGICMGFQSFFMAFSDP